jgi:hypothetical protein
VSTLHSPQIRYDVRNLLDDQRLYTGPREIYDDHFLNDPSKLDEERFEDLDSDEELLFDMEEDERKDFLGKIVDLIMLTHFLIYFASQLAINLNRH